MQQSRKVIQLLNLLLLLFFRTRKDMSVASHAILSNFFEEQCPQNHLQYLSGLSGALFLTTFSENSCFKIQLNLHYICNLPRGTGRLIEDGRSLEVHHRFYNLQWKHHCILKQTRDGSSSTAGPQSVLFFHHSLHFPTLQLF